MNARSLVLLATVAVMLAACSKKESPVSGGSTLVPGSVEDFEENVANVVYFNFDSSELTKEAEKRLDSQICWLRLYSYINVVIEGRTDVRGTRAYNMCLSSRRANAVKEYLVRGGIEASRIKVIPYGMERVEYPGDTEEIHAKNRNCKTVIINVDEAPQKEPAKQEEAQQETAKEAAKQERVQAKAKSKAETKGGSDQQSIAR